ncbi:protein DETOXIFICATION 16-like [Mercurialis annua]|uniref:protein DETOXIFICATION 16-like n=1 Tax=Mercurialis annua TaxID=3986 RepID=UPI002160B609|nr:protein DETOXIFICATION 16-like [Mercurialis annua]
MNMYWSTCKATSEKAQNTRQIPYSTNLTPLEIEMRKEKTTPKRTVNVSKHKGKAILDSRIRVSNELGAGRPQAARLALQVMIIMALSEGLVVGTITILARNVWGKLYSNEEQVINYVANMLPLLAISDFLDGFQCVLSGAARGCGWQNMCACINLGAYYAVAIPCALLFAFV